MIIIGGDSEQPSILKTFTSITTSKFTMDAHDGSCRVKVLNDDGSGKRLEFQSDFTVNSCALTAIRCRYECPYSDA